MNDSLIYQSWYRNRTNFSIYNYKFNNKSQKTAEYVFNDSSGDSTLIAQKHFFYYDEKDNLKMISIIGKNGDPISTKLFSYDNNNNKIEERKISHYINLDKQAVLTRLVTEYHLEYY